ncbi:hypothetical protein [Rhizobium sp. AU243]|uniref:hypothetical protein n=1 Tax=Rhizobium sp. AU243 TaxID=2303425 RepID=UPI0010CBE8B7|nr:hypothetical protein [Rhizobium sp. AU243]TKV75538.1 hypothetical protein D0C28_07160 [Rhizobium sp. AU243]
MNYFLPVFVAVYPLRKISPKGALFALSRCFYEYLCAASKLARFLHLILQVQRGHWLENGSANTAAPRDLSDLRRAAVLFVRDGS